MPQARNKENVVQIKKLFIGENRRKTTLFNPIETMYNNATSNGFQIVKDEIKIKKENVVRGPKIEHNEGKTMREGKLFGDEKNSKKALKIQTITHIVAGCEEIGDTPPSIKNMDSPNHYSPMRKRY